MSSRRPTLAVETQFAAAKPWVPTRSAVSRWAEAAHAAATGAGRRARAGQALRLCVRVVGTSASRRLNREYRGKDRPTNVLSFPASAAEREFAATLGDLVICAPVVAREARAQGKSRPAHWAHMVVHGVLHLHGHDHERPRAAAAMERLEVEILGRLGYQDPYLPTTTRRT